MAKKCEWLISNMKHERAVNFCPRKVKTQGDGDVNEKHE